jgi:hypothetical protein
MALLHVYNIIEIYNDSQSEFIRSAGQVCRSNGWLLDGMMSQEAYLKVRRSAWLQRCSALVMLISTTFSVMCSYFLMEVLIAVEQNPSQHTPTL